MHEIPKTTHRKIRQTRILAILYDSMNPYRESMEAKMSQSAGEGTGAGLQEFLAWAGRTGEMNPTTADAWAVACRRILGVEEDPEGVNLRSLDIDRVTSRFENLNRTKFTSSSMSTYKARFASAVAAYLAWLDNEPWKPASRKASKPRSPRPAGSDGAVGSNDGADLVQPAPPPAHPAGALVVTYRVPLRPDLMIEVALPTDLTVADADRLAGFVRALAFGGS